MLCALFAEVLGLERVGIDDNFFELGGDSIVSIQLVSRARQAGLSITPRAVFQHQTVAALAAAAGAAAELALRRRRPIWRGCGRWLAGDADHALAAERGGPVGRFSQSMLLRCRRGCGRSIWRRRCRRCSIITMRCGCGSMRAATGGDVAPRRLRRRGRLRPRRLPAAGGCRRCSTRRRCAALIAAEAEAAERRLASGGGRDAAGGVVRCRGERAGRLLLTIHHLAVDGVSWRILVPDLAAAWQAIAQRHAVALPPRGTSFRRWARASGGAGAGRQVVSELSFWRGMLGEPSLLLATARLDPLRDIAGTAGHLTLTLPAAVTEALLTRVPSAFHGGINDVLLTGLVLAVADWCRRHGRAGDRTGQAQPCGAARSGGPRPRGGLGRAGCGDVDLIADGGLVHQPLSGAARSGAVDLAEALSGGPALGRALKTIKEQLRAVPGKGLGYGLLRYLNGETAAELAGAAGAAARLQLSGAVRGRRRGRGLGAGPA